MRFRQVESMHAALRAISGMKINENTDHAQLSALCMAIAEAELRKFCCGDTRCYNESNGTPCNAEHARPSHTVELP